jgi:hypothetical protein
MKMKIENIEDAVRIFEENARIQAETYETGNYKLRNKCFKMYSKCIVYLYEHNALTSLIPLLKSENVGVRYVSAVNLLPVAEKDSKSVLSEIARGDYGIICLNAERALLLWKKGEIIYPYQSGFVW